MSIQKRLASETKFYRTDPEGKRKTSNKNDFRIEENRAKSPYKIWISFKWDAIGKLDIRRQVIVRYAYNTKDKSTARGQLLQNTFRKYSSYIHTAILYNNLTGEEIHRWNENDIPTYAD
jgi:hypothetical protein